MTSDLDQETDILRPMSPPPRRGSAEPRAEGSVVSSVLGFGGLRRRIFAKSSVDRVDTVIFSLMPFKFQYLWDQFIYADLI